MDMLQALLMVLLHSQLQARLMAPQATDLDSLDHPMDLLSVDSPAVSQLQQSQPHQAPMVPPASPTTLHDQAALMALPAVPRAHTVPQAAHPAATASPIKQKFSKQPSLDTKKTLIKLYS